jgi:PAS domain S-box-containing protein
MEGPQGNGQSVIAIVALRLSWPSRTAAAQLGTGLERPADGVLEFPGRRHQRRTRGVDHAVRRVAGMSLTAVLQRPDLGGRWAELLAGASVVHEPVIERLDFPVYIMDLASRRLRAVNKAGADLAAASAAQLIGTQGDQVVEWEDPEAMRNALETLRSGIIDGYRARRKVRTRDGVRREVYVWCRAVELEGVRTAIYVVLSANSASGEPRRYSMPLLDLEPLVVGTTDCGWLVNRVSDEISDVLGWERDEWIGRPLLAGVHPDDVGDLVEGIGRAAVDDVVARHLRLRHRDGGWAPVQYLVVRLSDDDAPRVAFALLPEQADTPELPPERASELEVRLRRIAAEVRAAGVMDDLDRLPAVGDHPELEGLTTRQWEILVRLLRGDRVPTIARELHLSPSTVRNHLTAIFGRFDVHSQAELLARLRPR